MNKWRLRFPELLPYFWKFGGPKINANRIAE